jgi:hypothetical protein
MPTCPQIVIDTNKIGAVTLVSLVAIYAGFALDARRQLKKSLEESDRRSRLIHEKIDHILENEEYRLSQQ